MLANTQSKPKTAAQDLRTIIAELIRLREREYAHSLSMPSGLWKDWLQKLAYIRELGEESLQNIRLHVGMGFFIGANWSTVYYEAGEIKMGLKRAEDSRFIADYVRLTTGLDEKLKITERDPLREQIAIPFQGKFITEDVLRVQTTIANLRHMPAFASCVEIGGGYGALAHQILHAYDVKKYTIIDYPEILFYVAAWSKIINPDLRIAVFDGSNHAEIAQAQLALIPNFLHHKISIEADLLINENSFCEMSSAQVEEYLNAETLSYKYLYSNNRDRQFMNRDLPSLNTLLAKRFMLSPTPEEYTEYYKATPPEKRWNIKYIFFGSTKEQLHISANKLLGLTIRTEH